ncbi:hypothetical protein D3C71_1916370 [compost metagenome]
MRSKAERAQDALALGFRCDPAAGRLRGQMAICIDPSAALTALGFLLWGGAHFAASINHWLISPARQRVHLTPSLIGEGKVPARTLE